MAVSIGIAIFVLAIAALMLAGTLRLHSRFRDRMLLSYFFYLLAWFGLIFYMLVFFLSPELLPRQSHYGHLLFTSIFLVPLNGVVAYFFADFCIRLIGKTPSRWFKYLVALPFLIILIFYAREVVEALSVEEVPERFALVAPLSLPLMFITMIAAMVYTALNIRRATAELRAAIRRFLLFMLGGVALGLIFASGIIHQWNSELQIHISMILFALINIPGLTSLDRIAHFQAREKADEIDSDKMPHFVQEYGISDREQEVISLLLAGKNNKEVEAELFISAETVKKHIYNIYKKVGVKNRVQLMNAVLGRNPKG